MRETSKGERGKRALGVNTVRRKPFQGHAKGHMRSIQRRMDGVSRRHTKAHGWGMQEAYKGA
eukprot:355542-Chlamydomonas_euryale.AAC.2